MDYRIILDKTLPNCHVLTRDYGTEPLHIFKTLGPLTREIRYPVYQETLKTHHSENYFYIVDNRAGHEISLSFDDMSYFNGMFYDTGIRYIRGAVVTNDAGYGILVSMAIATAKAKGFPVELISTADYDEAADYVLSKIAELQGE